VELGQESIADRVSRFSRSGLDYDSSDIALGKCLTGAFESTFLFLGGRRVVELGPVEA